MKHTAQLSIIVAAAAAITAGAAVLAVPACMSVTCDVVGVVFANPTFSVSLGDSLEVSATTLTSCPDRISQAVNFSSSNPAIFTATAVNDTLVRIHPVAQGTASLVGISRDRPNLKASATIDVTQPNP